MNLKLISLPSSRNDGGEGIHFQSKFLFQLRLKDAAYLFGDGIIGNSSLIGGDPVTGLLMMSKLLNGYKGILPEQERGKWDRAHESFIQCLGLNKSLNSKEVYTQIHNLKEGQSLLVPGGWSAYPGHWMLYSLTRQQDNRFTLNVINPGSGLEQFHQSATFENKALYDPFLTINDIPTKNITQPLLRHLLSFRTTPNREYTASHLYTQLIPQFGGTRVVKEKPTPKDGFSTP